MGVYVAENQDGPQSIFATDIDGNGNQDIVVAITNANIINYYMPQANYIWGGFLLGNMTSNGTHRTNTAVQLN